ncbi:hypothetical protein SB847_21240, partial [Bacillus sp. SIMBA_026]
KRNTVNGGKLIAGSRDQPGLHARGRSNGQDGGIRPLLLDGIGDRQQRTDVPGRSAAGKDD